MPPGWERARFFLDESTHAELSQAHRHLHHLMAKLYELRQYAAQASKRKQEWPRLFDAAMNFLWRCHHEEYLPDGDRWQALAVSAARGNTPYRCGPCSFSSAAECIMQLTTGVYHCLVNTLGTVSTKADAFAPPVSHRRHWRADCSFMSLPRANR
jgi:hypothetical protein